MKFPEICIAWLGVWCWFLFNIHDISLTECEWVVVGCGTGLPLNKEHKATAEKLLKAGEALIPAFKAVGGLAVSAEGNSAYVVALLRDNGDGTLSAVYGINNESLVGAVLTFAGKKLIESQQSDDANTQMRNVKSKRSSILAKAA